MQILHFTLYKEEMTMLHKSQSYTHVLNIKDPVPFPFKKSDSLWIVPGTIDPKED